MHQYASFAVPAGSRANACDGSSHWTTVGVGLNVANDNSTTQKSLQSLSSRWLGRLIGTVRCDVASEHLHAQWLRPARQCAVAPTACDHVATTPWVEVRVLQTSCCATLARHSMCHEYNVCALAGSSHVSAPQTYGAQRDTIRCACFMAPAEAVTVPRLGVERLWAEVWLSLCRVPMYPWLSWRSRRMTSHAREQYHAAVGVDCRLWVRESYKALCRDLPCSRSRLSWQAPDSR